MKILKKFTASSAVTIGALVLALALLGYSTIGGARAALTYYSEDYVSTMQLQEIGVSLYENSQLAATGNAKQTALAEQQKAETQADTLLNQLLLDGASVPQNAPFQLGTHYDELLAVHNPTDNAGDKLADNARNITQYVRVTIYRYWSDKDSTDEKRGDLDPAYIQLWLDGASLDTPEGVAALRAKGWLVDEMPGTTTDERLVLYYTRPVAPGATTEPFADHFSIDPGAGLDVKVSEEDDVVTRTYLYDNADFHLEVKVDAVQDHNAADAALSAWGRVVTINANNDLSLG